MTNSTHYSVREDIIRDILRYVQENNTVIRDSGRRKQVVVENLMLRAYLNSPEISYSVCRKTIQPFCPEYALDDASIRSRAEEMGITERTDRALLVKWAVNTADQIYQGLAGDNDALRMAKQALTRPYHPDSKKMSPLQYRIVLSCLFEIIPQLTTSDERELIIQFGKTYSKNCLTKIMSGSMFDNAGGSLGDDGYTVEQLRRELYIARQELIDYKELTEAADAEFDDKLAELHQRETAAFFSQLNSQKYGYLIDSLFLLMKGTRSLHKSSESIPAPIEAFPAVLERLMDFLKDSGISPATNFPPNSVQELSPAQMEGCNFEADPGRSRPLTESSVVPVRVVSSGWKYRGTLISPPVYHELPQEMTH